MQRTFLAFLLALCLVLPSVVPAWAAPPAQASGCLFFSEAAGGAGGFAICDDAQGRFRSAFQSWGLQRVGYPISQRYTRDGFVTQAFQKAIFQWRPDGSYVALVNVFDDLHVGGFDERLLAQRQTPTQLPAGFDGDQSFAQVVQARQALLNARPALRSAYFSVAEPLLFYGLPTSAVTDMGNHYAVRLQRAVLQEWKEDVPWAKKGQVTVANGGDIAKELGGLPATALAPQPLPPVAAAAPVGQPVRIQIARLGINAALESVGLDSQGRVDVPQGVMNAAWYNRGPRPGEPGNAIINGHLDDYKGDPAVFWRLHELRPGDRLTVTDAAGRARTFEVTSSELFRFDDPAPLPRIYGITFEPRLNLITCNGTWDANARNYDKRLVVFTRLVP